MRLHSRLDKVEAAIAANEPKAPLRLVRIVVTPDREAVSATFDGKTIERLPGEAEEAFHARVDREIRESAPADSRPLIPVTDDDINL